MASSQLHHLVAMAIWNTVYKERLPWNGAKIKGFTKEVQAVFNEATKDLKYHKGSHPALNRLCEVLLRKHVVLKARGSTAAYSVANATEFVKIMETGKWNRMTIPGLREFYSLRPAGKTVYMQSRPLLNVAIEIFSLPSDADIAKALEHYNAHELEKLLDLLETRRVPRAGSRARMSEVRRFVREGKKMSKPRVTAAGRSAAGRLLGTLTAAITATYVIEARANQEAKQDEIHALQRELARSQGRERARLQEEAKLLMLEEVELDARFRKEVLDAMVPFLGDVLMSETVEVAENSVQALAEQREARVRLDEAQQFYEDAVEEIGAVYEASMALAYSDYWVRSNQALEAWFGRQCERWRDEIAQSIHKAYEGGTGPIPRPEQIPRPNCVFVQSTGSADRTQCTIQRFSRVYYDGQGETDREKQAKRCAIYVGESAGKDPLTLVVILATWDIHRDTEFLEVVRKSPPKNAVETFRKAYRTTMYGNAVELKPFGTRMKWPHPDFDWPETLATEPATFPLAPYVWDAKADPDSPTAHLSKIRDEGGKFWNQWLNDWVDHWNQTHRYAKINRPTARRATIDSYE